ncbi:hypothetical protein TWF696_009100 [Orbilia brochopaga]|uniref:Enoyl reductase (ER) domain-containing protein n=1 Tax=Orbilia brochopaga TaxID=3140254 RepID=A0AAV9UFR6_9PEZI
MIPTKLKKLWLSSTGLNRDCTSSLSVTAWCESSGYEHSVQVTDPQNPDDVKVEISGYETTVVSGEGNTASSSISPLDLQICWNTTWETLPPVSVDSSTTTDKNFKGRNPIIEIHLPDDPPAGATELANLLQLKLEDIGYEGRKIVGFKQTANINSDDIDLKIILWDVGSEPYFTSLNDDALNTMRKSLNTTNHVLWVTTSDSPTAHIIDGLSRVVRREQNMSSFATILTTSTSTLTRANAISRVSEILLTEEADTPQTFRETTTKGIEVCRLTENKEATKKVQSVQLPPEPVLTAWNLHTSGPLRMAIDSAGDLDTIHFIEDPLPKILHDDEVEVEIKATAINFKDCIAAAGASGERSIGNEIAGIVARTGHNVKHLTPGDRVCGFATYGFRTLLRNPAETFSILPDSLSFSEAASIPFNFVTALYTLQHTAQLTTGDSILIHRGAGGTGQAAIQVAKYLGATTIFTTAGTSEKRELIAAEYGIPQEHIFNSRDNDFVAEVLHLTNGRGVDVVLNSLSGEQSTSSWECIAPFGRFVEIGRQGVPASAQGMKSYSFTTVDMAHMARERPVQVTKILTEALSLFEKKR